LTTPFAHKRFAVFNLRGEFEPGAGPDAEYIVPDKQSDPVILRVDRNADGRADVMYFDFQRRGKWDLSFWDENYDGHWTLVGYHPDGSLIPSRFESYEAFQRRRQAER
jgi:hypothetical protein